MFANNSPIPERIPGRLRYLLLAAAIATFLLLALGSAVRVSGAASACPDWPTCYGQIALPADAAARLNLAHRGLAGLSALLVWVAAGVALARYRTRRVIYVPLITAAVGMGLEIGVGALTVRIAQPGLVSVMHLGLALATLGAVTLSATAAFLIRANPALPDRLAFRSPFSRLALATLIATAAVMLSGAWVSATGAGPACAGWPLCAGGFPADSAGTIALAHRMVTLIAGGLALALFWRAWRSQRSQIVQLPTASGVTVLMAGQVLIGALKVERGFPADLVGLHAAATAGVWALEVLLITAAGLLARSAESEAAEAAEALDVRRRFKDFVILSKPIIVLLLLVTTYAGMVVGGRGLPSAQLTLWTLLGGALAAGGASALNQYIDRETDKAMQRTAHRPLPDGRFRPPEALAYGLAACLTAFFLLAGFVNLLAAVLSLAGMVYYVLLYSVWLKHATVQNIVIGGGAGAIPPLVGWAAATGRLDIPALFLFAIIFLWTPPHFWALAIVRRNDYARGKVPMLPVVRGEEETRRQVFVYTLQLVGLTLLMPLFKLTGSVYLISALALGGWLIGAAWRVLKLGGNKTAWMMYRTSSMYLAFLFLALVVDVLVK